MEILNTYLPLVVTLVVGGYLGYIIKNFLPTYFNEKGKNLATKEDIAEITQKVEEVKYTFTAETEKLRATLSFSNNILLGSYNESKSIIIEYFEKYNTWLNSIYYFPHFISQEDIQNHLKSIESIYYNFVNINQTRLYLIINNQDILSIEKKLFMDTFILYEKICSLFLKINLELGLMKSTESQKEFWKYIFELRDKAKDTKIEFQETLDIQKNTLKTALKNHLNSILQKELSS